MGAKQWVLNSGCLTMGAILMVQSYVNTNDMGAIPWVQNKGCKTVGANVIWVQINGC